MYEYKGNQENGFSASRKQVLINPEMLGVTLGPLCTQHFSANIFHNIIINAW